jgi:excisionase family DNA binding protein
VLTVPQAADRVHRNPETIRRWIRRGRLRARKVGTQHVINEADLDDLVDEPPPLPKPEAWKWFDSGRPQPDWAAAIRRSREGH